MRSFSSTGRVLGALRSMAAKVPVILWYLGLYLMALIVASVTPESRLLVPLLPIVFTLAAYGVNQIAIRFRHARPLLLGAAMAFAAYLLALQASGRYTPPEQKATCKECQEMFAYVRQHSAPGTVVMFYKPRAMALLGDRPSWAPSYRYSPEQLEQRMARPHTDLVVDGVPGSEFARRFPAGAALSARIHGPDAVILFRNSEFLVVRLGAPRQGS